MLSRVIGTKCACLNWSLGRTWEGGVTRERMQRFGLVWRLRLRLELGLGLDSGVRGQG